MLLAYLASALIGLPAAPVKIDGGADASGHNYQWRIRNLAGTPIVEIRIPQVHADLFMPPTGWTHQLQQPAGWLPGTGIAVATSAAGIAPGASADFGLRIGPRGTTRGQGDIILKTADGTEFRARAEIPLRASWTEQYMSAIALGIMFVAFVVLSQRRRRKRTPTQAT